MQIQVKLYSIFRQYARGTSLSQPLIVNVSDNATIRDVLVAQLGIPEEQISLVVLNDQQVTLEATLHEGDQVLAFPPIGGG